VVRSTESTCGRQESTFLGTLVIVGGSSIGTISTRSRAIDVVRPILNLGSTSHSLGVRLLLEVAESPREEPTESDGHGELDEDDSQNKDQREVEQDVGSDATDRFDVDETDTNRVDQTLGNILVCTSVHVHGNILALESGIRVFNLVEDSWVSDLRRREPIQQTQIEDGAVGAKTYQQTIPSISARLRDSLFVNCQVPRLVLDLVPLVVDLTSSPFVIE